MKSAENDEMSIVQVMHQTVREFFLRPDGYAEKSKFRMNENQTHLAISLTCLRYLLLCFSTTRLKTTSDYSDWKPREFEVIVQCLQASPLLSYALQNLAFHMRFCLHHTAVSDLVSTLIDTVAEHPIRHLLSEWMRSHLGDIPSNRGLPCNPTAGEHFRNRVLHVAVRMKKCRAAEALLLAGTSVDCLKNGETPLIVSASKGAIRC